MKRWWSGRPTGSGVGRPLRAEAIYGPVVLIGLWLFRDWIVLALVALLLGWIVYCLGLAVWRSSGAGQAHAAKGAAVHEQLRDLRAAEFERKHGVPMPVGYGYYSEVKPGNDRRDMRFAR